MSTIFLLGSGLIFLLTLLTLLLLFRKHRFFDRLITILLLSTNVVLLLLFVGFLDGRQDMYVDIAIAYAILSIISSIIVARFLDGSRGSEARELIFVDDDPVEQEVPHDDL